MKKVLKIFGIILLVLILFLYFGFKILANIPTPSENYYKKLNTGGKIEAKYLQQGNYEVLFYEEPTLQWFEKYEIWYPTELENSEKSYPVIVINNGTGWKATRSKYIYEHYASWGFIVIGTEETYSWNAFGAEMSIRHLKKLDENKIINEQNNVFYQKIDFENVGIVGHSQGGAGVINAITNTEHKDIYKTAISLSPTNKELAEGLEWHYDATKINIPIMLISGEGGGDDWVVTGEQLEEIYNDIESNKIMFRRKNTPHGETAYSEDGYVIAWFMWKLQNDEEASKAFVGENPEILQNSLYQDVKIDLE